MNVAAPEINVDELMMRIREEVARRKQQLGAASEPAPAAWIPERPAAPGLAELLRCEGADGVAHAYRTLLRREPEPGAIEGRLPMLAEDGIAAQIEMLREMCDSEEGRNIGAEVLGLTRPYPLGNLLGGDDPAFVVRAYQALLGYAPDEENLQTYLSSLKRGALSRSDVLRALRYSEEGRKFGVEVAGLLPLGVENALMPGREECTVDWTPEWGKPPFPAFEAGPMETPIAVKSAYELGELLNYQDDAFIRNAYRAILRREPDSQGFEIYLRRLQQGALSKIDILGSLRFSREGRQIGVAIPGLFMPWLVHLMYRVPLLGFLVALTGALLHPGKTVERLRSLEANLGRLDNQLGQAEQCLAGDRERLVAWLRSTASEAAGRFSHAELELWQLKLLVDAKANQAEFVGLQDRIKQLQQGKADQRLVETLRVNLRNALEAKAEVSEIATIQLRLKQAMERLDSRANQQSVAELHMQLQSLAEDKADAGALAEMQQLLGSKADAGALAEMQQLLGSKADAGALAETRQLLEGKADAGALAE
ncbi:MAG: DUF4214 domain-containing protein, partial [Candidatus Competibacteraceae bacterium]|nr:DUF4214 domain-containing protein [Candidatus Competibacteraceae bacterium]